ncbi:hypothetical protein [Nocardia sp. NPDC057455]|uniref:hypothetical protein n=1 Tax=Nocardia sp. NPDC057455 TaxID=3346138 RepID=UPI00367342C3
MKKVDILEMPTRSEMRNPEALKNRIQASNGGRADAFDTFRFGCLIAATGAEENGSDDNACVHQFADALPGWLSRLGLNLDVHACGVLHTADGNNTTDSGDASSIYWTMTGFSDRPRVYEAIAFPAGTPAPSGSLIQQYDGWSQNAARIAEEESSDSARFSAFVEAMSGSLNSSGKNFGGTSFSYCNCDGSETYIPATEDIRMLWSVAGLPSFASRASYDNHMYECVSTLPK